MILKLSTDISIVMCVSVCLGLKNIELQTLPTSAAPGIPMSHRVVEGLAQTEECYCLSIYLIGCMHVHVHVPRQACLSPDRYMYE